jgi:hypothetical protein
VATVSARVSLAHGAGVEGVVGDVGLDLGLGEGDHFRLLCGGDGSAQAFEGGDAVDPVSVRAGDGGEIAEAGDQRGDLGRNRISRCIRPLRSHVRSIAPTTDKMAKCHAVGAGAVRVFRQPG